MSAAADALAAQLEAARLSWVPVGDEARGQAVQIEAPGQYRAWSIIDALREVNGDALVDMIAPLGRAWRGVTSADLQGAGVGSADPAPFSARLLRLALLDRPQWLSALAMAAVDGAKAAHDRIKAAAGN